MFSPRVPRLLAPLLAIALVVAGCAGGSDEEAAPETTAANDQVELATDPAQPLIVATTTIIGDVVAGIAGEDAVVEVLMPAGVDPHDFSPSAQQAALLREASLVIVNGAGLEARLASTLEAAVADGVRILEVVSLIDTIPLGGDGHDHDDDAHGHDHDHGEVDPHFWHDPLRMAEAVPGIVAAMIDAEPSLDTPELHQRAVELVARYGALHEEVAEVLTAVPEQRRLLVTSHDSLGYLASRYGFEVVGAIIPGGDTLAAPSAADLAALVEELRAHDLPAIFAESTIASDLARALAAEVGVHVEVVSLYTDSLGAPGSGAESYPEMLLANARLIAAALG